MARTTDKKKEGMGARVEAARKQKGWSQEQLADYLMISRSAVKSKEMGDRPFTLEEACALCDLFHLTLDYLVNGVETINVSFHNALGLDDKALNCLRSFHERQSFRQEGLNMALSSPDVLTALSRYMSYVPEEKGYYLSELMSYKDDKFIECRMSHEFFSDVLKQNLLHMLDNAKAGDYSSTGYYEAYEDFMEVVEREREAKLAEPTENEGTVKDAEEK
ncbi:helix-turn-helix transcriptional regulator [Aristaeella hokkaidonensis]|uniref:Helix-turn-helix transcriptional regulator n=1 Tax=Aristaeella hokkaidonensis TaxID=3046382 RepID=A0AC61N5D0_9FIRM|nr:helix-turn-helix transcriptional regulator [Aristaeella hokkaidonensis]QUC66916.1 helix-turn-helix transcriptional regulator [Aristaeella hokkaidonensis]SNT94453.1 Helix-turn-helix [Aristaeella hokkaidonensis]